MFLGEEITEKDPRNFKSAWFNKSLEVSAKWRKAFSKEINRMKNINAWEICEGNIDLEGRKPICGKWIFNVKRDGSY